MLLCYPAGRAESGGTGELPLPELEQYKAEPCCYPFPHVETMLRNEQTWEWDILLLEWTVG